MRNYFALVFLFWFTNCGDKETDPVPSCDSSDLQLYVLSVANASACGVADGTIKIAASGGVPPYQFSLGSKENTDGIFTGLLSGIYVFNVSDTKGCSASLPNISLNATGLDISTTISPNTLCTGANGAVTISVSGTGSFLFKLGDGSFGSENSFTGLDNTNYEIYLKNDNGCTSTLSISIPQADTQTSWSADVQPIVKTFCATSGCHNGSSRPDLSVYDNAKKYASQMKTLTQNKSMPARGALTQQQIDLIACWVSEGALLN